ncbi:hypothetical protein Dimus_011192 [Dionaea muscipula]
MNQTDVGGGSTNCQDEAMFGSVRWSIIQSGERKSPLAEAVIQPSEETRLFGKFNRSPNSQIYPTYRATNLVDSLNHPRVWINEPISVCVVVVVVVVGDLGNRRDTPLS